jgi:hypothetical protein
MMYKVEVNAGGLRLLKPTDDGAVVIAVLDASELVSNAEQARLEHGRTGKTAVRHVKAK